MRIPVAVRSRVVVATDPVDLVVSRRMGDNGLGRRRPRGSMRRRLGRQCAMVRKGTSVLVLTGVPSRYALPMCGVPKRTPPTVTFNLVMLGRV
jgi:hypothetical protein